MLETLEHGPVRELRLSRPPANALNGALIGALTEALLTAAEEADAVVVSGLPGMFSAGLDVPELMGLDRAAFTELWHRFIGVQKTIATLPIPVVFAMTGHAPAGGILLGLYGDYRIMPRGPYKTGLNEVQIGLAVPVHGFEALVLLVGPKAAEEVVMGGNMMSSQRAAEIGLIDELADDPEAVVTRAIEWSRERLALPSQAMLATRSMARSRLHDIFENHDVSRGDLFIDIWFTEETQARLRQMVAALKKKS